MHITRYDSASDRIASTNAELDVYTSDVSGFTAAKWNDGNPLRYITFPAYDNPQKNYAFDNIKLGRCNRM